MRQGLSIYKGYTMKKFVLGMMLASCTFSGAQADNGELCLMRIYDSKHMSRQPRQNVNSVAIFLKDYAERFELFIRQDGLHNILWGTGTCVGLPNQALRCSLEVGTGEFTIVGHKARASMLFYIDPENTGGSGSLSLVVNGTNNTLHTVVSNDQNTEFRVDLTNNNACEAVRNLIEIP